MRGDLLATLAEMDRDDLQVVALGPGYGESVLVRVPPGLWVVVDCFRTQSSTSGSRTPVAEILEAISEPLGAVLLTHPHDDHAPGLGDLIDQDSGCLIGCCEPLWVRPYASVRSDPDLTRRLGTGAVGHSLARIRAAWDADPARHWSLEAGTTREVGRMTRCLWNLGGGASWGMVGCAEPWFLPRFLVGASLSLDDGRNDASEGSAVGGSNEPVEQPRIGLK